MQIQIEKMVFGGEGLARLPDGRAVFVPFVLPGELVEIPEPLDTARVLHTLPTAILRPSPFRRPAPCPLFSQCGGCAYQHIDYTQQLELKSAILREQFERMALLPHAPIRPMFPSPLPFYYRNQIQLHPNPAGQLCFRDFLEKADLPVSSCPLALPGLNDLLACLNFAPETGLMRISLREDSFGKQLILMEGQDPLPPEMELDLPVSVAYLSPEQELFIMAGDEALDFEDCFGAPLQVSPQSFFQVNLPVAETLAHQLAAILAGQSGLHILELYSGVGYFSRVLAPHARELTAIEAGPSACYDFAANLDAFEHISLYEGPVEQILPALLPELAPVDLVLLDPPRAGLHPRAREALLKLKARQIVYISCDPATLARDVKALAQAGYKVEDVQGFDMFPQTFHVETVVLMSRVDK